jgi:outer membrane protein assembly factor BamB
MAVPLRFAVLVAVVCVCVTTSALARSHRQIHSRVDLASGSVTTLEAPSLAATAVATPRAAAPLTASDDAGVVVVRTAAGKDRLKLSVGKLQHEWMPWWTFQPGLFVFDWRERVLVPGGPETIRDVLRAVDLATGTELWRRETAGTAAIGDRRLVVRTPAGLELIDSRTGRVERPLTFTGEALQALAIAGGGTLIDTGQVLARLEADGTVAWQMNNLGTLLSVTPLSQPAARYVPDARAPAAPLPPTAAWLLVTSSRLAVIDPVAGKVRWSAASTSTSVLLDGAQLLAAEIKRAPARSSATVALIVRDLATGKVTRELALVRHDHFFDTATAAVVARRGNLVEATSEFIVLD